MAAVHQKIHPVGDMEGNSSIARLVPRGSATSEKGGPVEHHPQIRAYTAVGSRAPRSRSCCCRFLCWIIIIVIVLLVMVAAAAGILYLVFNPKIPKYSVDNLRISDLRLNYDMTLYTKFIVKITANNPNKKIGIYYEKDGQLSVWYTNTKLCDGPIPIFYQGHRNITKLDVSLAGQVQSGSTLMAALQEQQQTGRIPLDLKIHAPVAIKLGRLKLRKIKILGDCTLIVDSLSTNNLISIKASNCKFRFKL